MEDPRKQQAAAPDGPRCQDEPDTEERLRMVLAAARMKGLFNASFVSWIHKALVTFLDKFTVVTKLTDDLAYAFSACT